MTINQLVGGSILREGGPWCPVIRPMIRDGVPGDGLTARIRRRPARANRVCVRARRQAVQDLVAALSASGIITCWR